ncbi:MAG: ATP-binding protein [bacterium]
MTEHAAPAHPSLAPEDLRWYCDPGSLPFADTTELEPHREIIGQARALRAIQLGLEMDSPGYNIFVTGFVGTGRNTTIRSVLERLDHDRETPPDLCYVHNFVDRDRPKALVVPAGRGRRLAARMKLLLRRLERDLPQVFESEEYLRQRHAIVERFKTRQREGIQAFEKKVEAAGFALVQVQAGPIANPQVVPVWKGEPKILDELETEAAEAGSPTSDELKEIHEKLKPLSEELQSVVREAVRIETDMLHRFAEHAQSTAGPVTARGVEMVREDFRECPEVMAWLDQVERDVLAHLSEFVGKAEGPSAEEVEEDAASDAETRYAVNVVVDNSEAKGAPVVVENMPTASQLFGLIDRVVHPDGEEPIDHTKIRAGSLHRANGGYLVLNATDVFSESAAVWNALKRTLRTGRLEIPAATQGVFGPVALKPEPVCISVKVVLIGDVNTYSVLHAYDDDFRKIFKVRADFDTEMPNGATQLVDYGRFVQRLVEEETLPPFDRTAVARIAEYGVRLAGRRNRISTRFNLIADAVREAAYFARRAGAETVDSDHVQEALDAKDDRNALAMEKMQELIEEGSIFIDVDGMKRGQLNGLAVFDAGEFAFGLPSKITASVAMGNSGIINIEREAELSGRTYDKGIQILSGYIRQKYAQEKPLTLSASVCFEQSYHGVDGDSASSTEIYAILSALSGFPLRQDLAVTGSVNQKGDVQPIGGVNEKIEGFFDVCVRMGLTGQQGVLIPASNVAELMLAERVVQAVRDGRFHIFPVHTIDQGIEILTGVSAGERYGKRPYPRGTVNGQVDLRLREMARAMRDYTS